MRIGIVGAGLCGLACAALLARRGHAVEVLERAPDPRPMGAGLLLQPPGIAILDRLGVRDAVLAGGARITQLDSRAASGTRLLDLHYGDLAPGLFGLGVERPAIWSALMQAAGAAGARLLPGHPVLRVAADDACATACFQDAEARHYDLLVVAAGTHARLWTGRAGHVARPYPWGCLWASVTLPESWPRHVLMQRCAGTRVMVGVLPTGGDTAALYWSIRNDAVPAWRAAPLDAWRAEVARAWPEAGQLVAGLGRAQIEHASYRDVWADPPHAGRLLVVGDAAHGTSPQLGQGTTQALRDALTLADALDGAGTIDDRLRHYWAWRRAGTGFYRLASRLLTPVFQSALPGLGWARDLLAGPIGRIPFVRRQALLTLTGQKDGVWHTAAVIDAPASVAEGGVEQQLEVQPDDDRRRGPAEHNLPARRGENAEP